MGVGFPGASRSCLLSVPAHEGQDAAHVVGVHPREYDAEAKTPPKATKDDGQGRGSLLCAFWEGESMSLLRKTHVCRQHESMAKVTVSVALMSVVFAVGCGRRELRETKYPSGAIWARGYVTQDAQKNYVLIGHWTYWYPNGQKEAEGEYQNARDGGKRGSSGILMDGREGPWIFWHPNGAKMEESVFKNGKAEGLVTVWYDNGAKKKEAMKRDGKSEGTITVWHKNGQKSSEASWKHGKLDGEAKTWDENGHLKHADSYKNGKLGVQTWYYESGQKMVEYRWQDGKPTGEPLAWKEDGSLADDATRGGIVATVTAGPRDDK